jgi:hypothetical protein
MADESIPDRVAVLEQIARDTYTKEYLEKITSARLNALSTASAGFIPFLMTSA